MSDIKLGTLVGDHAQRDAVHIAIAPVTSDEHVSPGQHVVLVAGTVDKVQSLRGVEGERAIGIVDPFLPAGLAPGHRFWLCLYSQTVTSLRHEWTHPAFDAVVNPIAVSKAWLAAVAAECGVSYERMMSAVASDDYINMGENEHYKSTAVGTAEFKRHCELVLGRTLEHAPYPFSCSC